MRFHIILSNYRFIYALLGALQLPSLGAKEPRGESKDFKTSTSRCHTTCQDVIQKAFGHSQTHVSAPVFTFFRRSARENLSANLGPAVRRTVGVQSSQRASDALDMVRVEAMVKNMLSSEIAQLRNQIGGDGSSASVVGATHDVRLPTTIESSSRLEPGHEMNTVLVQLQQAKLRLESQKRFVNSIVKPSDDSARSSFAFGCTQANDNRMNLASL